MTKIINGRIHENGMVDWRKPMQNVHTSKHTTRCMHSESDLIDSQNMIPLSCGRVCVLTDYAWHSVWKVGLVKTPQPHPLPTTVCSNSILVPASAYKMCIFYPPLIAMLKRIILIHRHRYKTSHHFHHI